MTFSSLLLCLIGMFVASAVADDFFTIVVTSANYLQRGNHTYTPSDDESTPISPFYKDISVILAVEKDIVGVFVSMPAPAAKESIYTGVPCFTMTLRTDSGEELVTKKVTETAISARVVGFKDVLPLSKLPGTLKIEMVLHHPRETVFSFILDDILSVKDGMYDLKPANTTMGTYFVIAIANNSVTWYLKRRPPIPPFVFTVLDGNNEQVLTQVVNKVGPDGIGFKNVLDLTDGGTNLDKITFRVQFRERYRARIALATIKQPQKVMDSLKADSSLQEIIKPDHDHEVLFQLQYFNTTRHVALMIIQVNGARSPLGHLQVHVTQRNLNTGEVRTVFLEEERQVPVLPPEHNPQFGWYHVFQTETKSKNLSTQAVSKDTKNDEGQYTVTPYSFPANVVLDIEAIYDFRQSSTSEELFFEWCLDYGSELQNFYIPKGQRQRRGTKAAKSLKSNSIIGSMPYRLLLTQESPLKYQWWQQVKNTESWSNHIEKFGINTGQEVASSMTFFALMKANSPIDGLNWRLFYDNILGDPTKHHQTIFWSKEELELLKFSYASSAAKDHRDVMESEYTTIGDAIKWFTQRVNKTDYFHMRTHIAARLLNISGTILAAPIIDYLHHDDAPNVVVRFDDTQRRMNFVASREIIQGAVLSMNYGTESKTKQEFLIQYGYVPVGARDASLVKGYLLGAEKTTRNALLYKMTLDAGSVLAGLEAFAKVLSERVGALPAHIVATGSVDPHRVHLMERILESERYVLHRHLQWVEEDISAMSST